MKNLDNLVNYLQKIVDQIVALPPFRPGTLIERYRKCGKKNCKCAQAGHPGHGPSWSLTYSVNGKTKTQIIDSNSVESVQSQIAGFRKFKNLMKEYVSTNIQICDSKLDEQGSKSLQEKKGSRQKSKMK